MSECEICNKETCDDEWLCKVEETKRAGGVMQCPNGLRVRCITAQGLMLEHEDADHPDYIFPVDIEYCGTDDTNRYMWCHIDESGNEVLEEMDDNWKHAQDHETHALIYADSCIAVTMFETCYAFWQFRGYAKGELDGSCMGGHLYEKNTWRLSDESIEKIKVYVKNSVMSNQEAVG